MTKPIDRTSSGGDNPEPLNVDPKIWTTDTQQHSQPMLTKQQQDLSVVRGNELVVSDAFVPTDGSVKLSGPIKQKSESSTVSMSADDGLKSDLKFKSQTAITPEQSVTRSESTLVPPKVSSPEPLPASFEGSNNKVARSVQLESPALGSDIVSTKLTVSKSDSPVLPKVDFVEPRTTDPILSKQPILQARVEHTELPSAPQTTREVLPQRVEARPLIQTTQAQIEQPAPRLLSRMTDVVQNSNNQPDLQLVEKIAPKANLQIASNAIVERGDDNSLIVQNAKSERPVSLRLEQVIAHADTTAISPETRLVKLATAPESVRFISTPANNLVGFSRYVEMAQVASLRPQTAFNIRGQEVAARTESIATVLAQPTRIQPLEAPQIRSPLVAGIVKSVLTSLQTAQSGDALALQTGPRANLDAQSIIKANLNPLPPGTTGNAALVGRADFTVRDFRPPQTNAGLIGQPGDIRTNLTADVRTDGRSPVPGPGINGVELSFGKRKKKDFVGPASAASAESAYEDSRYITGLELGLIIALAGIAKFDPNDRTNRKVFNPSDTQSNSTIEESKIAKTIGKSIENKKVSKRLPSYNWTNEWKSPGKIQVKNVLEKLKKERKDLNAKDIEKLESSTNAEELMSRLGKLVKQDEKSLDKKHTLSSFSQSLREKFKVKQNAQPSQTQTLSNYRPLWLVCENDSLTTLAEQIYQDPDVGWLIADMNSARVRETWMNQKRVIQMQSRQQIELPIQEDIDLFKQNKTQEHCAENLITVVIQNQLDKDHLNNQLQALQINRKALGTT
jgi:hypothetical protein